MAIPGDRIKQALHPTISQTIGQKNAKNLQTASRLFGNYYNVNFTDINNPIQSVEKNMPTPAKLKNSANNALKDGNQSINKATPGIAGGNELDRVGDLGQMQLDKTRLSNEQLDWADNQYAADRRKSGQAYIDAIGTTSGKYKPVIEDMMSQARQQADDSSKVYTGSIRPALQTMMDRDMQEAKNAMTLEEAGNPDNAIHQRIRAMYNQQGENVQRQGLASSGVLSALGAQNAATAFGAQGPMTVGQQQAMFAASQGQAGQAFARAQQEMNRLREQGINTGFEQSGLQYERGERAKGRAKDAAAQFGDEEDRFNKRQGDFRNEIGRGAADILGLDMGLASAQRDFGDEMGSIGQSNAYNRLNRGIATDNTYFNNQMQVQLGKAAERNADQAGKAGVLTGLLGAVGTGVGAYYSGGNPAAAAAGGAAGSAIGGAMAPKRGPITYPGMESAPPPQQQGYTPYSPYGQRAYA